MRVRDFTTVITDTAEAGGLPRQTEPVEPAGGWVILPPYETDDLVAVVAALNVCGRPPFFVDYTAG